MFSRIASLVAGPDRELRIELAAGQLVGVALLRYVLAVEPIASASTSQLVELLTPTLNQYLAE